MAAPTRRSTEAPANPARPARRVAAPANPARRVAAPAHPRAPRRLVRFDGVERAVHWVTALLVVALIATGAVLYVPQFARGLGGRDLAQRIHVIVGLVLLVPVIAAVAVPWGAALRADIRRVNRFGGEDRRWFRAASGARLGKFNPGQKLNTVFVGAAMVVLLLTGLVMHWPRAFPLGWRTGATFVHDCFAIALTVVLVGHVVMALTHPKAMRAIVSGWVDETWAARHAPAWLKELREKD